MRMGTALKRQIMPFILVVTTFAVRSGCGKSDWIERTLVTADVTGTWVGRGGTLELALEQHGPKVTGKMQWRGIQPFEHSRARSRAP